MSAQAQPEGAVARRRFGPAAARWAAAIRAQLWQARVDLAILAGLAAVAAIVRLVMLEDIPPGIHGDEGWTGIDARRVLDEGWIGPYVSSALGQPTGFIYLTAPFVKLFGDTVFAIRVVSALTGTATVLVAYLTFRVMFDRPTGAIAAFLLAVTVWHLHFSRIAFTVISWPLLEMLTLLFLFLGLKTGRWHWYGLAGLAFGLGVYTYNAYPVFIIALVVVVGWLALGVAIARIRGLRSDRELLLFVGRMALLASVAILAALPLIRFAMDDKNDYFGHHRSISLFEQPEWDSGSLSDRAELLWDGASDYFTAAFWRGGVDGVDGAAHQALVDKVSLILMVAGVAILLWRWRHPSSVTVFIMVALLPVGAIITTQGDFRRTLGIVPFLAVLTAVPLALWWRQSEKLSSVWRYGSYSGIAIVLGLISFLNLNFYFGEFEDTSIAQTTFGQENTDASIYISDLPDDTVIYFYSGRWSYDYETRRYLAPDHRGEDRSVEHGGGFDLTPRDDADIAYVFLWPYMDRAGELVQLYPGGTLVEGGDSFRAYLLPRSVAPDLPSNAPKPTPVPPEVAEQAEATSRDVVRIQDLATIRQALEGYRDAEGKYPDTGGLGQTLCAYVELDIGCALRDILGTIPHDPEGGPDNDGYWYISDGSAYTLYALRETDSFPACRDHPEFLDRYESLHCIHGP
ncbi:MAG: glycosyltransferase family 39 protein [Chloroflexi bacterium]|nr:glycosyltransferase family 39 protein [Chloroflexota bacterium]